jgi:hypothetical protein
MKEQFQYHELTPKTTSSTLNEARFQSGNIPMPEPGQTEPLLGQQAGGVATAERRTIGEEITDILQHRIESGEDQDVEQARQILEMLSGGERERGRRGQSRSVEEEAFQIAREAFEAGERRDLSDRINNFSTMISTEGFSQDEYEAISRKIQEFREGDNIYKEDWEKREEQRRHLGMALAAIVRKTPNLEGNYEGEMHRLQDRVSNALSIQESTEKGVRNIENQEAKYTLLDQIVESFDINDGRGAYGILVNKLVTRLMEKGDRRAIEYVLEYAMERFFSPADNQPHEQFPQLNFYQQQNVDAVIEAARNYSEDLEKHDPSYDPRKSFHVYLSDARSKRMIAHELFRGMKDPEKYKGGVADFLRKEGLAFIEDEVAGVKEVERNYERILSSRLSFKDGWFTEEDFVEADNDMQTLINSLSKSHKIVKELKYKDGGPEERDLRKWEINRALSMGRAMTALSQRRAAYTAMGDIPQGIDEFLRSVDQELIVRTIATLKFIPARFFDQPIAKKFMEIWLRRMKEKNTYGIARDGEKPTEGLFGRKLNSMALLDTGNWDLKSNSWRARLLYLKQKQFSTERLDNMPEGAQFTIGEYLDLMKIKVSEDLKKELKSKSSHLSQEDREKLIDEISLKKEEKERFNDAIREVIEKQRLFLGVLVRYEDLDDKNKQAIWEKIAKLNPSKIAAYMPKLTLDIVKEKYGVVGEGLSEEARRSSANQKAQEIWDKIKMKLWQAEDSRVSEDSKIIQKNVKQEATDMFAGVRDLDDYLKEVNLVETELEVVKGIIKFGENNTKSLAEAKHVFITLLEDAPRTGYDVLGSQDVGRGIGDQGTINEGLGQFTAVAANPARKPGDIFKNLHEYWEKLAGPLGIHGGQKNVEVGILTWLEMAKMYPHAKHIPLSLISDPLRVPESLLEFYNLQSDIALDDQQVFDFIRGCAQTDMISDDLSRLDEKGRTAFMRLREETNTETWDLMAATFRMFIYLFGFAYAMEMIKLFFPKLDKQ